MAKTNIAALKRSHKRLLEACRFALSVQRKQGLFDVSDRLNENKLDKAIHGAEQCLRES